MVPLGSLYCQKAKMKKKGKEERREEKVKRKITTGKAIKEGVLKIRAAVKQNEILSCTPPLS